MDIITVEFLEKLIKDLQYQLNKCYNKDTTSPEYLYELSQELDVLIVEYLKIKLNDNEQ